MPITLTESSIVVVEGKDDKAFFTSLETYLNLKKLQIETTEGTGNLRAYLKALINTSGFDRVISLGIVCDADENPVKAFQGVQKSLRQAGLSEPSGTLMPSQGVPSITVMILPDNNSPGMLENLCLRAFDQDPSLVCVDEYFECLQKANINIGKKNIPKAKIRAFLSSKPSDRGKVDLWLGSAVEQPWWPWNHTAFDQVKSFLYQITSLPES